MIKYIAWFEINRNWVFLMSFFASFSFKSAENFFLVVLFNFFPLVLFLGWLVKLFLDFWNRLKLKNFLLKSPLNLVLGSLGSGKTAFLVYISELMISKNKKKNWTPYATFPLETVNLLSLGHMSLLSRDYEVLPKRSLLLWDESNLFLEGTAYKENDKKTEGLQEYFSLARHFGHLILVSGQRAEHIWVKLRDIANSVIVSVKVSPITFYRPYLQVVYGSFKSVSEYEDYRKSMISAVHSKEGKKTKFRDIPSLDIYFFKLKIHKSILNKYSSTYMSWLRDYKNTKIKSLTGQKWEKLEIDYAKIKYLKMEKFSSFFEKLKELS